MPFVSPIKLWQDFKLKIVKKDSKNRTRKLKREKGCKCCDSCFRLRRAAYENHQPLKFNPNCSYRQHLPNSSVYPSMRANICPQRFSHACNRLGVHPLLMDTPMTFHNHKNNNHRGYNKNKHSIDNSNTSRDYWTPEKPASPIHKFMSRRRLFLKIQI